MIFRATDPYAASSWSDPVHFNFTGYDPSPFWDTDGKVYMTASHAWQIRSDNTPAHAGSILTLTDSPELQQAEIDLETGKAVNWRNIWNGTGGLVSTHP